MNLHRPTGSADWHTVSLSDRNRWQKFAAQTGGIITPGNIITVIGFMGSVASLYLIARHFYIAAFVVIGAARFCDILDGWLADKTGTKSKLGANLDAGFDKLSTVIIPIGFIVLHILPIWAAVILLAPHLIITYIGYVGLRRKSKLLPSQFGKLSMAAAWVSLLGFVALASVHAAPIIARTAVYVLVILSGAMSSYAAFGYARTVFKDA